MDNSVLIINHLILTIMNLRKAERKQARMRMSLQGPSGSGKTYGALKIAFGLCGDWSKICVIDSESTSSDLYAHLGHFNVLGIGVPFSPEMYIEAIELAEKAGMEVIILDSISHEWEGEGGILQIHSNMPGNSFTNWNKVTPRHNAFVQKMLQSKAHIIATIRTKMDYVLNEKNGKQVPEKVGLKGVTRDGMDYEFTLVLDLDIKHNATASKDRTGVFMDKPAFVISEETGQTITSWCNIDENVDQVIEDIRKANSNQELQLIYNSYPEMTPKIRQELINRNNELKSTVTLNEL